MDNLEKRDTLSIISHELRTSLIADKWVLKMLFDGDLGSVNEKQKVFLERALKNNEKMIELITELVETGHSNTNINLSFEEINLSQIAQETLGEFEAEAQKRNITLIDKTKETGVVFIEANKNKIHSAIQELINNALKYTEKGSVSLEITSLPHGSAVISVQDTGIGIPEHEQKKICEKFFRGEEARKKEEIGSGLGLFAVRKIAEKHGGTFSFISKIGQGSTFRIEIPIKHSR